MGVIRKAKRIAGASAIALGVGSAGAFSTGGGGYEATEEQSVLDCVFSKASVMNKKDAKQTADEAWLVLPAFDSAVQGRLKGMGIGALVGFAAAAHGGLPVAVPILTAGGAATGFAISGSSAEDEDKTDRLMISGDGICVLEQVEP